MRFVVCTRYSESSIGSAFGQPEYSYYFVLREFMPLLESLGSVVVATDEDEAIRILTESQAHGEPCYFLQFTAPHNSVRQLRRGAIPVFAWEFDSIPDEAWSGNSYNNWRAVLLKWGAAITHSQSTVKAVRRALGDGFPIVAIPAPVWDRCGDARQRLGERLENLFDAKTIEFFGVICDSASVAFPELEEDEPDEAEAVNIRKGLRERLLIAKTLSGQIYDQCLADLIPFPRRRLLARTSRQTAVTQSQAAASDADRENLLVLSGVVYTSIFNPADGRKNWEAMLTAFCWAFRETDDATLVIKLSSNYIVEFSDQVVEYLGRIRPFRCRVVVIKAFLGDEQYQKLLQSTSFYVNTSYGEGQCLPLMEFLSSGIPALAPANSAMADYMSEDLGFVIESRPEPTSWQHDTRRMMRTLHYRVDWLSTVEAFRKSYALIHEDREAYAAMSRLAAARMKNHCSIDVLKEPLVRFLREHCSLPCAVKGEAPEEAKEQRSDSMTPEKLLP